MNDIVSSIMSWLESRPILGTALGCAALILVAYLADVVARRRFVAVVSRVIRKTSFTWDDALHHHHVLERLMHVVPGAVVYYGVAVVPGVPDAIQVLTRNVAAAFMLLMALLAVGATMTAANEIYETFPAAKTRPVKGYIQVAKIAVYVLGGVVVVATLIDRSPLLFVSGIGAMTAVLVLVFRDTILSLVAGIQLSSLDLVRVGDWIEVPTLGADGDVIDIALHTIRVQNWDKTIVAVPTHKLITQSFKNWRGMQDAGGRRIKRSIFIDKTSVRFLTAEEVERFKRFALLKDYIQQKQSQLQDDNTRFAGSRDGNVNARRLTNIGTFRAYVVNYLRHHPSVHQALTLMVRQRDPTPNGIPLEIYAFTNDTRWTVYEGIQSDIFDHIMAIVSEFGLRLFQNPTGADFRAFGAAARDGTRDERRVGRASDAVR